MTASSANSASSTFDASATLSKTGTNGRAVDGPIHCPMCGLENLPDAIFCANEACHKAIGGFRYVSEELHAERRWHEKLAERVTAFIGKPRFFVFHILWFSAWIAFNSGLVMAVRQFDSYPFNLLGILLSAEAVLVTGFILIRENQQNAYADKRAEIDYEISVRTYREVAALRSSLDVLAARFERLEAALLAGAAPTKEKI